MLTMPRRSVTRFFIPLIDVLTLLFCVFLVTPLAEPKGKDGTTSSAGSNMTREELAKAFTKEKRDRRKAESELQHLREQVKKPAKDRVALRILEIDGKNGKLFYQTKEGRTEIEDEVHAVSLIEEDKKKADMDQRELLFVIQFPAATTGYPNNEQIEKYTSWFRKVQMTFEKPG